MSDEPEAKAAPPKATDEELDPELNNPWAEAWLREHLPELRQDAYGQRLVYWSLSIGFVVGLAAYLAGHALRSMAPTEPVGLLADLLYSLGFALWTGVVVVLFVEVVPEAKRRQIKRALDAYEAAQRTKTGAKAH